MFSQSITEEVTSSNEGADSDDGSKFEDSEKDQQLVDQSEDSDPGTDQMPEK